MTPLVFVHGFMGGGAQWQAQKAAFAERFDVICPDLPGFGANSDMAPVHSIPAFANWVIGELRRQGVTRYHLVGHSMGGMIVQDMVRLDWDNIERLILYGTGSVGVLPGRFETIAQSKARAISDGAKATARRISATWFLCGDADPAYEGCASIAEAASPEAIQAGLDAMESWHGTDALASIGTETLILWGDQDRTYPWSQTETLWRMIPRSELAVVPGCAHAVHLEKPQIFNMLVADFLGR